MFRGFILCDKRTGSTFLQNCLDSHPNITCYDELFMIRSGLKKRHGQFMYRWMNEKKGYSKDKFLDWLGESNDNVFLKLIYDQCDHWNLNLIIKKRNLALIHLVRKNHFKKAMSGLLKKNFDKNKRVNLNPNSILSKTIQLRNKTRVWRKKWKKYNNQIIVFYENMVGETKGEIKNIKKVGAFNMKSDQITYLDKKQGERICKFLDIPYFDMSCNLTKKSKENPLEYLPGKKQKIVRQLFEKNGMSTLLD